MRPDNLKMEAGIGRAPFQDVVGQQQRFLRSQSVAYGSTPVDPHFQSILEAQRRLPPLSPSHEAASFHSTAGMHLGSNSGSCGIFNSDIDSVSMAELAREASFMPPDPMRFTGRTRRDSLPEAPRRSK